MNAGVEILDGGTPADTETPDGVGRGGVGPDCEGGATQTCGPDDNGTAVDDAQGDTDAPSQDAADAWKFPEADGHQVAIDLSYAGKPMHLVMTKRPKMVGNATPSCSSEPAALGDLSTVFWKGSVWSASSAWAAFAPPLGPVPDGVIAETIRITKFDPAMSYLFWLYWPANPKSPEEGISYTLSVVWFEWITGQSFGVLPYPGPSGVGFIELIGAVHIPDGPPWWITLSSCGSEGQVLCKGGEPAMGLCHAACVQPVAALPGALTEIVCPIGPP